MKYSEMETASVEELVIEHTRLVRALREATQEKEKESLVSRIAKIRPVMRRKGIPISPLPRDHNPMN